MSSDGRPSVTPQQETIIKRIHSYTLSTYKHVPYDYYKILNLDHNDRKNITQSDLKKTYRKLAINLHPDKNSHEKAPDCFKLISKVYEHLSDENNKKSYDIDGIDYTNKRNSSSSGASPFGAARRGGAGQSPFFHQQSHNPFFQQNMDIDDLFSMFTGGGGSSFQSFQFDPFSGGFTRTNRAAPRFRQQQSQQNEEIVEESMVLFRALIPVLIVLFISIFQRIFNIIRT